jgi:hypothetical protein
MSKRKSRRADASIAKPLQNEVGLINKTQPRITESRVQRLSYSTSGKNQTFKNGKTDQKFPLMGDLFAATLLHGTAGWRRELGGVGRRPRP